MRSAYPPSEPISNITRVAVGCNPIFQVPTRRNAARVVNPGSLIERRDVSCPALVNRLCQAIPAIRTGGAFTDHLRDDSVGTRVLDLARDVAVAGAVAVMVLHKAGVTDAVVGGRDADTAARFLDHDGEDEAVVYARFGCDLLDSIVNGQDFRRGGVDLGVLGAGGGHNGFIVIEPVFMSTRKGLEVNGMFFGKLTCY